MVTSLAWAHFYNDGLSDAKVNSTTNICGILLFCCDIADRGTTIWLPGRDLYEAKPDSKIAPNIIWRRSCLIKAAKLLNDWGR